LIKFGSLLNTSEHLMGLENKMLEDYIKLNNLIQPEEKIKSPNAQFILCATWYWHCHVKDSTNWKV